MVRWPLVLADESTVREAIGSHDGRVTIAAVNGPRNVVISGNADAVEDAIARLGAVGVTAERLTVSHAFHSPLMDPILAEFEQAAAAARPAAANLMLISNLTGSPVRREVTKPSYWHRHLREPVQFASGIRSLYDHGYRIFVEIGPQPVLSGMGQRCVPASGVTWLSSLRRGREDWAQVLDVVGQLYVRGSAIDWNGFNRDYPRRKRSLPTYPFERARYWVPAATPRPAAVTPTRNQRHPLLGNALKTAVGPVIFSGSLSIDAIPFLADHQKHGLTIFPATAYLEMGLSAAPEALGPGAFTFEELVINEPLQFGTGEIQVQVVVTPRDDGGAAFQLFSQEPDPARPGAGEWRSHASGTLRRNRVETASSADPLDAVQARCLEPMPIDRHYEELLADGHEYGPAFRGIAGLWRGESEVLARVALPAGLDGAAADYGLHPVLLDAALQTLGAAAPDALRAKSSGETFLPVSLGQFRIYINGAERAWSHVRLKDIDADGFAGDVRLYDDDGRVIAELLDVYNRRAGLVGPAAGRTAPSVYELVWRVNPREPTGTGMTAGAGTWVLIGRSADFAATLARRLAQPGRPAAIVELVDAYQKRPGRVAIDSANPEHFARAFAEISAEHGPIRGVVHLACAGQPVVASSNASPMPSLYAATRALLYIAQALGGNDVGERPRLVVVTAGAIAVAAAHRPIAIEQAPLWGLARTIAAEHPDLQPLMVDLDPMQPGADLDELGAHLLHPEPETQVAFRDRLRYVARLVAGEWDTDVDDWPDSSQPLALQISEKGTLDALSLVALPRRAPLSGEVEVQVEAAGLNFRDVLNTLGMYEGEAGPLGGECVGRIVRIGAGVERLKVGDQVMGVAPGTFGHYVTSLASGFIVKPAGLDVEAAATIPVAFLTAEYGLNRLAGMKAGDRVLIHAAAGGVGVAAVRLAQRAGAEIFATAGSPEKHAFLRSLGVQHIMSSRSVDFAAEVHRLTNGEGVDIVMNSLAGEFIEQSVAITRKGGRFVEIGRAGIWTVEQMAARRPDIQYFPFLLSHRDPLIQPMLADLADWFGSSQLQPLPRRSFPLRDAVSAFRYMAQAKQIGKIVLTIADRGPGSGRSNLDPAATYLVTGGFGALGRGVIRWLVAGGARHLALTNRGASDQDVADVVAGIEAAGATVHVMRTDVSSAADVSRLFAEITNRLPPLRGIVHAAGVIADGVLLQQAWPQFETVLAPKVLGAWHLHEGARQLPLDFFVMFSSMASVLGGAGQGNYAVANAFLDALAHHRQGLGLAALSINWGAWDGAGMSGTVGERDRARWQEQGHGLIQAEQGLAVLGRLAAHPPRPQVVVLPIDWTKLFRQFPNRSEPRLLQELAEGYARTTVVPVRRGRLVEEVIAAAPNRRRAVVAGFLRDEALKVLGLDAGTPIDPRQPLREFGLDSLMAVELRNGIGGLLDRALPATLLFKYPTLGALTQFVLDSVPQAAAPALAEDAMPVDAQAEEVALLSDEEVKRLLAVELEALAPGLLDEV